MMHVPVQQFQGYAEQHAAALARRARMYGVPVRKSIVPIVRSVPAPAWQKLNCRFNAHVHSWYKYQISLLRTPALSHVLERCEQLGFTWELVKSNDRTKSVVAVRHLLIWEVRDKFGLSLPKIGSMFGGLDHTSALHAIKKINRQRGMA